MAKSSKKNLKESISSTLSKNSLMQIIAVLGISLLILFVFGLITFREKIQISILEASYFSQEYQAVFLDNGHIYFGKIVSRDSENVVLQDVHYMQVSRQLQPDPSTSEADTTSVIKLKKLGNEYHQPENFMVINRDHVLFMEDLQSDSEIYKTIKGE